MSKLTWKLKNQMARDQEEEEAAAAEGKKSYICPYCQKLFSNGKAYAGHKRSHLINHNNNNNNKGHVHEGKIQISNSKNHHEAIDDQDYLVPHDHDHNQSSLCDKKLSSDKSLYCHMKINHSERAWRSSGIKPRFAVLEGNSSSSTVSVDVAGKHHEQTDTSDAEKGLAFDLSNTFLSWVKTGKRGRKDKGPMQSLSHDAANHLLALANAEPHQEASLPPKKRKSSFSSAINGDVNNSSPEKLKSIESFYSKSKNQSHEVSENDKSKGKGKGKALAFMVSDDDDDDNAYTPITSLKHVCSICNRSFRSYQAMGGHKAHHGRKDGSYSSSPSIDHEYCFSADDNYFLAVYNDEQPLKLRHKCPFCSKTFPKGQALGGHKRHCKETPRLDGEVMKKPLRRALYFDLKKLPPAKNGAQKKAGKAAMETQEITLSLPWHEDGAEQDTISSNTSPS